MPERWFRKSEDGTYEFDPQAGPNHSFGVVPRGSLGEQNFHAVNLWKSLHSLIFPKGRRLAMHTMKTFFVLVLWEFELLPLPSKIDSFASVDLLTHQPLVNHVRLRSSSLGRPRDFRV